MAFADIFSKGFKVARGIKHQLMSRTPPVSLNLNNYAGLKVAVEGKNDLPAKPKKPLTPYFRFMAQIRPDLTKEYPNARVTEIVKMVAEKWEKTDPGTRQRFAEEYKRDLMHYEGVRNRYEESLTDEQKELIQRVKLETEHSKQKRKLKKKMEELGKPKKPCSAFIGFINSKLPARGNTPFKDWQKEVAAEWNNLSDEVKATYQRESSLAMDSYRQQLQEWEERMIRKGHIDVVRSEALLEPRQSRKVPKGSAMSRKSK